MLTKKAKVSPDDQESEGRIHADVRDLFVDTWLSVYDDIRWFFLRESACVCFRLSCRISS